MKVVSRYIIITAIGLFIFWLFFMKSCKGGRSDIEKAQDSLNIEKTLNDSLKIVTAIRSKQVDSLNKKNTIDSFRYTKINDSLKKVIAVYQGRWNIAKDSIGLMYGNLKKFYEDHDTVALVDTYNRLNDQLTEANTLLFSIQISRDSLENAKDTEIVRLQGVIVQLQGQLAEFNKMLRQSTDNEDATARQARTALNKLKRRTLLLKIASGIAIVATAVIIL